MKPSKALSVRASISVFGFDDISCGFSVLGDFLCGFSVSAKLIGSHAPLR